MNVERPAHPGLSNGWLERFARRLAGIAPTEDRERGASLVQAFWEQAMRLPPEDAADVIAELLRQDDSLYAPDQPINAFSASHPGRAY